MKEHSQVIRTCMKRRRSMPRDHWRNAHPGIWLIGAAFLRPLESLPRDSILLLGHCGLLWRHARQIDGPRRAWVLPRRAGGDAKALGGMPLCVVAAEKRKNRSLVKLV